MRSRNSVDTHAKKEREKRKEKSKDKTIQPKPTLGKENPVHRKKNPASLKPMQIYKIQKRKENQKYKTLNPMLSGRLIKMWGNKKIKKDEPPPK